MTKLSFYERMILEYISFRTNNNKPFFETNRTLAKSLDLKESSAKVLINKLIRNGYLCKLNDNKHKRLLKLSGKEFPRISWINMSDVRAHGLKIEYDELKKEFDRIDRQRSDHQKNYFIELSKNDELTNEIIRLKNGNALLEKRLSELSSELNDKTRKIEFVENYLSVSCNMNKEKLEEWWLSLEEKKFF